MSHHNVLSIQTSISYLYTTEEDSDENCYDAELLKYNVLGASKEDWERINSRLYSIEWNSVLHEKNVDQMLATIVDNIENIVKEELKDRNLKSKPTHNS